jgi:hypothetical protein
VDIVFAQIERMRFGQGVQIVEAVQVSSELSCRVLGFQAEPAISDIQLLVSFPL